MIQTKWASIVFSMWKSGLIKITKITPAKKVKLKAFPHEIYFVGIRKNDQMINKLNIKKKKSFNN